MTIAFDAIVVAVADIETAAAHYEALFNCVMQRLEGSEGQRQARLTLSNTAIVLEERAVAEPAIVGLVLSSDDQGKVRQPVQNSLGLDIALCSKAHSLAQREQATQLLDTIAVDHVVLRTADAQGCIDLFAAGLGLRLALDKTVAEWGGRMLFFRAGKMTLEVIANDEIEGSSFWGIAYRCSDIEGLCAILADTGIAVSDVREGRKPGTRVATVKSHCLGIPTLLIAQAHA